MTGDQLGGIVASGLCLVLVASALIARRLDAGTTIKMGLAWAAIFVALVAVIRLSGIA